MRRAARTRAALALTLLSLSACGQPQIGADKSSFKAVDALYTAIGLREPNLVDRCDAELKSLREGGRLPADAANLLDAIIAEARGGDWESAQHRLSRFMEGQHQSR